MKNKKHAGKIVMMSNERQEDRDSEWEKSYVNKKDCL